MDSQLNSNQRSVKGMATRRQRRMRLAAVLACLLMATTVARTVCAADKVNVAELSPEAEDAIQRGLDWLAKKQGKDGSWPGGHKCAITALSLMAFMLKGHFPQSGPYGAKLDKSLSYLIKRSKKGGGYFGGNMYEHALATLAISEAWGMCDREELRDVLKKAVDVIIRSQAPNGSWTYYPKPMSGDISITVMQTVALASAHEAGIHVPKEIIHKALGFVRYCNNPKKGSFGYRGPGEGLARSCAAVMALQMCGQRNSSLAKKGLEYIRKQGSSPKLFSKEERHYFYAHYYAVQCMYQAGDEYYQAWYPKIRNALLKSQKKDGGWGRHSTAYSTSMSILILGVPYRFLPIYQR